VFVSVIPRIIAAFYQRSMGAEQQVQISLLALF
jgi:hypothetical protein